MKYINFKAVFIVLCIGLFGSSLAAQTNRRRAKPLATPPPVLSGAEIISQAGNESEPALTPEEKPVKPASTNAERIKRLNDRVKKLESGQTYEDRQKRLLMNLDILTRSEQRAESLRKQLFEMIEKENSITARLDQIEYDIRPESIERSLQLAGSFRPEEVRENRRKSLAAERTNLQTLLTQVQTTRSGLDASLRRAEEMVEKLRAKAEKDIDDSLQEKVEEPEN
jgi:uncharacterized phage infection (PIP) family protein YhgE